MMPSHSMTEAGPKLCMHCGKVVDPDRERYCNHCGLPFRTPPSREDLDSRAREDAERSARTDLSQLTAGVTLVVGLVSTITGGTHLYGVIVTAARRISYAYDFRFASLLLVGILIVVAGALCISAVGGLRNARRPAWNRAVGGTILLLLVTVPLIPVQYELAGGLAFVGAVNLIALLGLRSRGLPGGGR